MLISEYLKLKKELKKELLREKLKKENRREDMRKRIAAGLLAFVVLYNLNNINISERRMELATIKVLGFYDGEVGAYVYRENILLTILGTIAGIILGILLHKYVIFTTEVDLIMFGRQIYVQSYIYSILLTIAFSILVNAFVYFQLKKIDMVESLKSTE